MYKRILAVINEFNYSETSAYYAIELAKSSSAHLFLFGCITSKISKEGLEKLEKHMNRVFISAANRGIEVESVIEKGNLIEKLKEKISQERIDLLLSPIGSKDAPLIKTFDENIKIAFGLVKVVNMANPHPRNVLIPLRGKMEGLNEWADFTSTLCKAFNAKATVLHITALSASLTGAEVRLRLVDLHKSTPDQILEFISRLESEGIAIKKRFAKGAIGRGITIEAATKKNDLIIMGISGRSALKKLLTEDPTAFVLKESPCNLIIFRASKR